MAPLGGVPGNGSGEPLSVMARRGLLALVIFFHVGGGWALTQVEPAQLIVGDVASLEVRTVPAEKPSAPEAQLDLPPEPPLPDPPPPPEVPIAEPPPPVEVPITDLATVLDPPPPDLPPPAFPIEASPPPPPPEQPKEPPKPKPPPPRPAQRAPAAPVDTAPQQAAPAVAAAPKTVESSQLGFLIPPNPVYPGRARRAGEQGTVMVRVLVDIAGRPAQVSLQASSGHEALDQSALSAVRAAQFRPYAERGVAQAVWVLVPIKFVLQ